MKSCPTCEMSYVDETLNYCLQDGSRLVSSREEPATAIMSRHDSIGSLNSSKSIAVLPFSRLSSDLDDEYFCDGLAEEILNSLARVDGLKVAARTSSFFYKRKDVKLGEIGRELGVSTVLEGSVRRSADRLRITVQLIDTSNGYQLWSERYDREMRDIFDVQDEITLAVVAALKVQLLGDERSAILKKGTDNTEVFDYYLRARALWNKRTREGFETAIKYLEKAIELDPDYALAYAGMADCYSFLAYFEWFPPDEMAAKARLAIEKAMELDSGLAECHAAMATFKLFLEFDFEAAEREYRAAISIRPNFPQAHYLLCSTLAALGRLDEAIDEGQNAVGLDPLSPLANNTLARALCYAGRPGEAVVRIEKCLEIAPDLMFFHWMLGVAYGELGQTDVSIDHFQKSATSASFRVYSYLGDAFIRGDRPDEARLLLDELKAASAEAFVSPVASAVIEAELGNMSRGLDLLEEAWKMKVPHLMWIGVENVFDVFRGEPRFQAICRSMGLNA